MTTTGANRLTIVAALFASAVTVFVPAGTASAQSLQDRGTEADQEACTPDVFRLCQDFIPDEGQIVACLRQKRDQLSPACGPVIFPKSQPLRN